MFRPATLVALAAIGLVLTLMGPFNTGEVIRPLPRLAYWLTLVLACYAWGSLVDTVLRSLCGIPLPWIWVALAGVLTGFGVTIIVTVLNLLALDFFPRLTELPIFIGTIFAISMVISFTLSLIARETGAPTTVVQVPSLLSRLPLDKRGDLVALSVEDHYVRVRTVRGEELVLMRLSDAIKEVGETVGAQVHRSHWAAFEHVQSARREGDRAILTMTGSLEIPVSRANLPKIREAGLLPERG